MKARYYGFEYGSSHSVDLGTDREKAIAFAKENAIWRILLRAPRDQIGDWVWESEG
jgi:hypothetical protein